MALFNKFMPPMALPTQNTLQQEPYVDDIFDPLFNAEVRNYYRKLYGPIGGIGAGYASMFENALTGHKGILGPGMGILSTFGRSMDKADDFILGGLTEGVNALGQITGGTNEAPQNPFKRIFADDYNYEGTKLMAAAGNAMAKMAGVQTPLTEKDFQSLGDKVAGLSLELATDPGIMGGQLARLNKGSSVGKLGEVLSSYDDAMANIAGNMAFPGGKALVGKGLDKILRATGANTAADYVDNNIYTPADLTKGSDGKYYTFTMPDPSDQEFMMSMSDLATNLKDTYKLNPYDDPELFAKYESIVTPGTAHNPIFTTPEEFIASEDSLARMQLDDYFSKKALTEKVEPVRQEIWDNATDFVNRHTTHNPNILYRDISNEVDITLHDAIKNKDITLDGFNLNDIDLNEAWGKQALKDYIEDNYYRADETFYGKPGSKTYQTLMNMIEGDEPNWESALDYLKQLESKRYNFDYSPYVFKPNRAGFKSAIGQELNDRLDTVLTSYLAKHPDGLDDAFFERLGISIPKRQLDTLRLYVKNLKTTTKNGKTIAFEREWMGGNDLDNLLDALRKDDLTGYNWLKTDEPFTVYESKGLIPWVRQNQSKLIKTREGRDLIDLVNSLDDTLDTAAYEWLTRRGAEFNPTHLEREWQRYIADMEANYPGLGKKFSADPSQIPQEVLDEFNKLRPRYTTYNEVRDPTKMLNTYSLPTGILDEKTGKEYAALADFDLAVSENYIKKSPQWKTYQDKLTEADQLIAKEQGLRSEIIALRNELNTTSAFDNDLYDYHEKILNDLTKQYKELNPKNLKPNDFAESLRKGIVREPTDAEIALEQFYAEAHKKVKEGKYSLTKITPRNIIEDISKGTYGVHVPGKTYHIPLDDYSTSAYKITNKYKTMTPNEFAYAIYKGYTGPEMVVDDVVDDIFRDFKIAWGLPDDIPPQILDKYIKSRGTPEQQRFFQLIERAKTTEVNTRFKPEETIQAIPGVGVTKTWASDLQKRVSPEQVRRYYDWNSVNNDIIIKGDDTLTYILGSQGHVTLNVRYTKKNQEFIKELADNIKHNVDAINKYGDILRPIKVKDANGNLILGYRIAFENPNIKKDVAKIYPMLGRPKALGLVDMTFQKSLGQALPEDLTELHNFFQATQSVSSDLATKVGFKNFQENYAKYAMANSEDAVKFWNEYNKLLGVDDDRMQNAIGALLNLDVAERGQFGAIGFNRSNIGSFETFAKGYDLNLENIHTSTFTKGMLDNIDTQTFCATFLSDNFKVNTQFDSIDTLRDTLLMKKGNEYTGNLHNMSLATPKYNSDGKLVGFTKYNPMNEVDLQQAWKKGAVLLPDSVFAPLDKLTKKNARMSNKVYRFINHYFTVPFKFGTLANPGFLVGNMEDAYFKQATTMANKYGTDLPTELSNVAVSMRHVTVLNNQFEDVLDGYRKFLSSEDAKKVDIFRPYTTGKIPITPDTIMRDPKAFSAWIAYVNKLPTGHDRDVATLYTFLNNYHSLNMFKNDVRDFGDVYGSARIYANQVNPYDIPTNPIERVFYGHPNLTKAVLDNNGKVVIDKVTGSPIYTRETGFTTYGLFLNNPVSNKVMQASSQIEDLMRNAAILNDLAHKGLSQDEIIKILRLPKVEEAALYEKVHIGMMDAVNTMSAANFDYNKTSDFLDKLAYILPFPTFYVKNLGYWAEIFSKNPQYIDNVISFHEGLWSGKNTDDEFIAQAKGRGAIPIGQQGLKHLTGIVKQSPYNSMFGAFNAVNNAKEDFAYRTHPVLRPIARHLQAPEDVKYRPYNSNIYQRNIKKGDTEFSELAYMFHQLNPYERFINTYARTPKKVANNTYQLSDFLPSMFQPDFSKK